MSYTIKTTNGSTIAIVQDATLNTIATSLTLVGRDYAGYGSFLNENFVYLLENFAANIAPANANLVALLSIHAASAGLASFHSCAVVALASATATARFWEAIFAIKPVLDYGAYLELIGSQCWLQTGLHNQRF
jgi:hypothetical protein